MITSKKIRSLAKSVSLVIISVSCSSIPSPHSSIPSPSNLLFPPEDPKLVELSVAINYNDARTLKEESNIVIADIVGECAAEVKDALMMRLIENSKYTILTRDNIKDVIGESDLTWGGRFNTKTAARLGELLGASLFIVGRVAYCGPSANDSRGKEVAVQQNILAAFQLIEMETGKIVIGSANEGKYTPRPISLLAPTRAELEEVQESRANDLAIPEENSSIQRRFMKRLGEKLEERASSMNPFNHPRPVQAFSYPSSTQNTSTSNENEKEKKIKIERVEYQTIKAAQDLANSFADKIFKRPIWENVEVWLDSQRIYNDGIRYIKLGQCPKAVRVFEGFESKLFTLNEREMGRYLHNYGVALLCAGNPFLAMEKLRSAYRINYSPSTLRMLGLAGRITEWSLSVEIDQQPEVEMLLERKVSY